MQRATGTDNAPSEDATPAEAVVKAPPSRRPRDMVISLLLLVVPVLLVVGGYRVLHQGGQPVVVDQAPALDSARAAGLDAAAPTGLDERWQPVSAVFRTFDEGVTLRLGYLTPDREGVQVVQSTVPAEALLPAELTGAARPGEPVPVRERSWQRYTGRPGETALVLAEPGRTTIVVGPAADAHLRALAASLTPHP